jgi:hypothetical protein
MSEWMSLLPNALVCMCDALGRGTDAPLYNALKTKASLTQQRPCHVDVLGTRRVGIEFALCDTTRRSCRWTRWMRTSAIPSHTPWTS